MRVNSVRVTSTSSKLSGKHKVKYFSLHDTLLTIKIIVEKNHHTKNYFLLLLLLRLFPIKALVIIYLIF